VLSKNVVEILKVSESCTQTREKKRDDQCRKGEDEGDIFSTKLQPWEKRTNSKGGHRGEGRGGGGELGRGQKL